MRGFFRWMFGDIVSVVAPRAERGPKPTRRAARWLIGIGLFITLFGAIGIGQELSFKLERQDATVVDRFKTHLYLRATSQDFHKVRIRLESGDTKVITYYPLYQAVGTRTDLPVKVDVDPKIERIHSVYVDGRRYYVGRETTGVVIAVLFTLLGAFLLLRGVGRLRRARQMYEQNL